MIAVECMLSMSNAFFWFFLIVVNMVIDAEFYSTLLLFHYFDKQKRLAADLS